MIGRKIKLFLSTRAHSWHADGLLRALLQDALILLGGNVSAGMLGLVSLALTARALGPEDFGILVLISTYVLVVDGLFNFQSWQALIKYGAEMLEKGREEDFKSLIKFGFLLDVTTAIIGTIIAASAAWFVGRWHGWNPEVVLMAALYSFTIIFHVVGTPTAVLRLFGKFKLFSLVAVAGSAIKLAGVSFAYMLEAGLWVYALIWGITDIVSKLLLVAFAARELTRNNHHQLRRASISEMGTRFPGIWRFVITTNLNSSIRMTTREVDVLIIGALLSPAAIGLYKIAKQVGSILGILTDPLYQSIYPELAKLRANNENSSLIKLSVRSAAFAGSIALLAWIILIPLAEPLLKHVFGSEFVAAREVMLWYVLAMVVAVYGFPLQPIMLALGRPQRTFVIHLCATALYFSILYPLVTWLGIEGAGVAYIGYYLVWSALMVYSIRGVFCDE